MKSNLVQVHYGKDVSFSRKTGNMPSNCLKAKPALQRYPCPILEISQLEPLKGKFQALVDTGSSRSFLSEEIFASFPESFQKRAQPYSMVFLTANSSPLIIQRSVKLKIKFSGLSWSYTFLIARRVPFQVVLGADFIAHAHLIVDIHEGIVRPKFATSIDIKMIPYSSLKYDKFCALKEMQIPPNTYNHLPVAERNRLMKVLRKFPHVLTPKLGMTHVLEYHIKTTSNQIVKSHPYQVAPPMMKVLREKID